MCGCGCTGDAGEASSGVSVSQPGPCPQRQHDNTPPAATASEKGLASDNKPSEAIAVLEPPRRRSGAQNLPRRVPSVHFVLAGSCTLVRDFGIEAQMSE